MREILFRGKRKDNGEWVEGFYTRVADVHYIVSGIFDSLTNGIINTQGYKVTPETVCQYTGLTDKNGRRIFEGDIVRLTDEHNEIEWTAVVVFGNPNGEYNWGWQLKAIGKFNGNKDILLWVDMEESGAYCEIIGNIYDNPELLEVKQNG